MNFKDKITTRKGSLGERIADRYLREAGYDVYVPNDLENSHPIDRVAVCKRTLAVLLCDVKTKPARVKYPDTGINLDHWLTYSCLAKTHNLQVFLVFVDQDACQIYGQFLHKLEQIVSIHHNGRNVWYPRTENWGSTEIRYFPIRSMVVFGNLTHDEKQELQELSTRHQKYETIANPPQFNLFDSDHKQAAE